MQHYGDITKIKGAEVPIVDVVTGGSPCQDLSVAGKRAGLAGERSGLFMEQIRIIKEMRDEDKRLRPTRGADEYIRPRYMVWENVPGAFSSNKGEDFRAVLEETARIADQAATIPRPTEKKGKLQWSTSGCIMGDGWSIAWRLHDAQFWGVPQRRKRISLVADFGGETAPEILFERESVFRDTTESGEARKGTAEDVRPGIEETGRAVSFQERAGKPGGGKGILIQNERTGALSTVNNQSVCAFEPGAASRLGGYCWEDKAGTLRANAVDNQQAVAILNPSDSQGNQVADSDGIYPTLRGCGGAGYQQGYLFERKNSTTVFGISSYNSNSMKSSNPHSGIYEAATSRTLDLNGGSSACNQGGMAVVYNGAGITSPINASNPKPGDPCHTLTDDSRNYLVQGADMYNGSLTGDIAATLNATSCVSGGQSGPSVVCLEGNGSRPSHRGDGYSESETMYTLNSTEHHVVVVENHPADSRVKISEDGKVQTLSGRMGTDGGNVPMVMEEPYNATTGSFMRAGNSGVAETLAARDYKDPQIVCNSVVRRLTPLECERLQGYPDGWTDIGDWVDSKGKKHKGESDSPRYKALGNSIALPFWKWMAKRMRNYLGDNPTMASLFDGIGGFPLSYQEAGVKPVWASEIEEFPIAVTKIRFPD